LPSLHIESDAGLRFILAMNDDDIDVSLYSFKSIQMLINFHWKQMQTKIYLLKIIPFAMMLVVFWIWSNIILQNSHSFPSDEDVTDLRDLRGGGSSLKPSMGGRQNNFSLSYR
jgi:hypothetical protein